MAIPVIGRSIAWRQIALFLLWQYDFALYREIANLDSTNIDLKSFKIIAIIFHCQ